MLRKRDLDAPDGRPLYQYRLDEEEFQSLELFLKDKIENLQSRFGLDYIAERPGFPDLFVLYCSEWWRRRYDGTGYEWEPILEDLGADSRTWTANQRSECVRTGLHGWNLRTNRTGGHRYLGAVAVQGGLPLRLIAEERGRIMQVISRVLRLARRRVESPQELQSWVESLQNLLPMSYRQLHIYSLLAEIAWTVLDLKNRAELVAGTDSIKQLDRMVPRWRDRFPLPVEDIHAQALIDQLVRVAASIRVERQELVLPLERSIEQIENGKWVLKSAVDLPDTIGIDKFAKLFEIPTDDPPLKGELSLIAAGKPRTTSFRRMPGQGSYRLTRTPWGYSGIETCDEHILRLNAADGRVWSTVAMRGQALDPELPWVFSGEEGIARLIKQGSGSISDQRGIFAIPEDWAFSKTDSAQIELNGILSDFERSVYTIEGSCVVTDELGSQFHFRTGNAGASEESYEWVGIRQWYGFKSPSIAFKGLPKLFHVDDEGYKRKIDGEIGCSVIGNPSSKLKLGPVFLAYPANGEIKHRTRMVLLPEGAGLQIIPDSPRSGVIYFENWGLKEVRCASDDFKSQFVVRGGDCLLELSVPAGQRAPNEVDVEVLWPHTTVSARLTLPFPAKGVRIFDAGGTEIESGGKLAIQQLVGSRVVLAGPNLQNRFWLRINSTDQNIYRKAEIKNAEGSPSVELRLADYLSEVEQLLTIDDDPDSTVMLEIYDGNQNIFSLEITPYAYRPIRNETQICVDFDEIKSNFDQNEDLPQAFTLKLERPGEEATLLPLIPDQNDGITRWEFSPQNREPGAWLVFPPRNTKKYFRPTLWTIRGDVEYSDAYRKTISIRDEAKRHAALDGFVLELSNDYLHENWADVEQLATQTEHLPLETLDIWRRFAKSSLGMASLAMRVSGLEYSFLSRFAGELPFTWETVAYVDWLHAIQSAKSHCQLLFGDDASGIVLTSVLDSRIDNIVAEFGALHFMLGILKSTYSEAAKIDVNNLRIGGKASEAFLFTGQYSPLNTLRQRHHGDNEEWPSELWDIISSSFKDPTKLKYLHSERLGYQDSVINLPLLLAAQVCQSQANKWFENPKMLHLLRFYRAFDPDWFNEAFNQTVIRCLADGILDIE